MKEKIENIGKNRLIVTFAFLLLIIIILFGGAFLYYNFFYKRSYSEIENIMLKAAQKHMAQNPNDLPKDINGSITLSVDDLVRTEEMEEISNYLKDDEIICTGSINIININHNTYHYTPNLDCGEKYQTTKFIDYIKKKHPIVENGNGLYNLNEEMVFRGDNVNNYLKLSGNTYRIVKFTNDEAVIIYTEKTSTNVWDDRYNVDRAMNMGINDYAVSKVKERLDNLYQGTTLLDIDAKSLVVAHNLEIGKRSSKDTDKSGGLEKSILMENQYVGLLPLYDFMNASLDGNCTNSNNPSCMNYNYLSKYLNPWWLATATNLNSYNVYRVEKSAVLTSANSTACVRPVMHLTKDALYVSGDGTSKNPYIVK